jgi:hypothetical protein
MVLEIYHTYLTYAPPGATHRFWQDFHEHVLLIKCLDELAGNYQTPGIKRR